MRRGSALLAAAILAVPAGAGAQEVASVIVVPERAAVRAGDSVAFSARALDAAGNELAGRTAVWLATPYDIAGADSAGVVSTFRPGQVFVVALVDGVPGMAILDIAERAAARLLISAPATASTVVGGVLPLAVSGLTAIDDPLVDLPEVHWSSRQPEVASVGPTGLVMGLAPGSATIVVRAGDLTAELQVEITTNPVRTIRIAPHPELVRSGDVVALRAEARDAQGKLVTDRAVRWSVSSSGASVGTDGRFVGEKDGTYLVTASVGAVSGHSAVRVSAREDARVLTAVAHYPLPGSAQAAEIWPIGDVAYVSTIGGTVYVFDISDPATPIMTDSLVVDARLLNDVSTTADGRIGVITREGASTRRNGILLFDASEPYHPTLIAEFNEGMTGGVHSAYVYGHHVFATDDATGSLRIIDIQDPRQPRQVARWEIEREARAYEIDFLQHAPQRYLHDVYVVDGLAYLAYWRDGLVILDVGNGIAGGTVEKPRMVSQLRYPHADLYPKGYIAGTHAVFRHGSYVFVADESYPGTVDLTSREQFPTRGLVHVVDVSDVRQPRIVAQYDPREFGAHNLFAENDLLYVAAYTGGIRILDIGGELRGDLGAQGRVIGSLYTGSLEGFRPNMALAWSAIPHGGYLFASDVNTGLWVARLDAPPAP